MLWLTDPQAAKPGNRMPRYPLSDAERAAILAIPGESAMNWLLRHRSQTRRHPLHALRAAVLLGRRHGSHGACARNWLRPI